MTPALRRARAFTAGTIACATVAPIVGAIQPGLGAASVAAAVVAWLVGRTYRHEHQAILREHEKARRAALDGQPQPVLTPAELAAFADIIRNYNQEPA